MQTMNADLMVLAATGERAAIRANGKGAHPVLVTGERFDYTRWMIGTDTPNLNGLILTAAEQVLAIGAKRQSAHAALVSL